MPELDTYHALERFAKDNANYEARQAYLFLKRRTELSIQWRAFSMVDYAPLQKLAELYLGVKDRSAELTDMADMSEPDRQQLFEWACSQTGVEIDPKLFTKND